MDFTSAALEQAQFDITRGKNHQPLKYFMPTYDLTELFTYKLQINGWSMQISFLKAKIL